MDHKGCYGSDQSHDNHECPHKICRLIKSTSLFRSTVVTDLPTGGLSAAFDQIGDRQRNRRCHRMFPQRRTPNTHWREYWDTSHVAKQIGIDAAHMFDALA